jgi:hypothetical protein
MAFLVQTAINAVTFMVEAAIDAIPFPVQTIGQLIPAGIRGAVRFTIKPRVYPIAFMVETVINSIASVVKPVFDAVAALVHAISLIGKNAGAEKCNTDYEQREDCHVPNFPDSHIRTPCIHMNWPLLPFQRGDSGPVDGVAKDISDYC